LNAVCLKKAILGIGKIKSNISYFVPYSSNIFQYSYLLTHIGIDQRSHSCKISMILIILS
jgi:hypothetical protein